MRLYLFVLILVSVQFVEEATSLPSENSHNLDCAYCIPVVSCNMFLSPFFSPVYS